MLPDGDAAERGELVDDELDDHEEEEHRAHLVFRAAVARVVRLDERQLKLHGGPLPRDEEAVAGHVEQQV